MADEHGGRLDRTDLLTILQTSTQSAYNAVEPHRYALCAQASYDAGTVLALPGVTTSCETDQSPDVTRLLRSRS